MLQLYCTGLLLTSLFLVPTIGRAQDGGEKKEAVRRAPVGRLGSAVGTLLIRELDGRRWQLPRLLDTVHAGDHVVALPGARARVDMRDGEVKVTLAGNLPSLTPGLALESAVELGKQANFDLFFVMERGRMLLESQQAAPLKVRVRVGEVHVDLRLHGPEAAVALERSSQWPEGVAFQKTPKPGHEPIRDFSLLVVRGQCGIEVQGEQNVVNAPVLMHWNSVRGRTGPLRVEKLPSWLTPASDRTPETTAWHMAVEKLRRRLASTDLGVTLAEGLKDADFKVRVVTVLSAGAIGDLPLVLGTIAENKRAEARQAAIRALRQFSDRGADADVHIYQALEKSGYSPGQGAIALHLLHGFTEASLLQPETYEALLNYLGSSRPAIRVLAAEQLYSLVPEGKAIAYDPLGPETARAQASAEWRRLIPAGQLPPVGKPKDK